MADNYLDFKNILRGMNISAVAATRPDPICGYLQLLYDDGWEMEFDAVGNYMGLKATPLSGTRNFGLGRPITPNGNKYEDLVDFFVAQGVPFAERNDPVGMVKTIDLGGYEINFTYFGGSIVNIVPCPMPPRTCTTPTTIASPVGWGGASHAGWGEEMVPREHCNEGVEEVRCECGYETVSGDKSCNHRHSRWCSKFIAQN